jgi:hypothetical protein
LEADVSEALLPPSSGLLFMNMEIYPPHCCLTRIFEIFDKHCVLQVGLPEGSGIVEAEFSILFGEYFAGGSVLSVIAVPALHLSVRTSQICAPVSIF